jgi:hypothetical protein
MKRLTASAVALSSLLWLHTAQAQLIDKTQQPNTANEGIAKSLTDEIGAGRGDWTTLNSSLFIIQRDPFRAIRRGRQLFQRKFIIRNKVFDLNFLGFLAPNRYFE